MCELSACVCVRVEGVVSFLMARERKDVSSLDSGVPLLLVKTKLIERRTRGGGWARQGGGCEERKRRRKAAGKAKSQREPRTTKQSAL